MSDLRQYPAIEIDSPRTAEMLQTLLPALRDLDYETQLHLSFLVVDFPSKGEWCLVANQTIASFDLIEPGVQIKTVNVFK